MLKTISRSAGIGVLCATLILAGCSFASFVAAAEADLPVVIQIVENITNLVAPGVSVALTAAGNLSIAGLHELCGTPAPGAKLCDPSSLVGQYQIATDSTVKSTLLQKVDAAIVAVNSHLADMLSAARVLNASIVAAVTTAVSIALETVTAIISLIPPPANATTARRNMSLAPHQPDSAGAIRKKYNSAIGAQFPGAKLA